MIDFGTNINNYESSNIDFADDLKNGIHALALHLYTKSEWESLGKAFPKSPNCLGVGQ